MAVSQPSTQSPDPSQWSERQIAERLERGEVVHYPICPFQLPQNEERQFLLEQKLASRAHKNISYDPAKDRTAGYRLEDHRQASRLHDLLSTFSAVVTAWLTNNVPRYATAWRLDQVTFRPEEEATRRLRHNARNDLLHVDAFPSRPTNGYRILRVFANVNPTDPRVWITSDPFAKLLERYGRQVGLPDGGFHWSGLWQRGVVGLFNPNRRRRSPYDEFMLRMHDFMKAHDDFQENCFKRYWEFQPGCAWMAITDTCSHAALRGRFALEHSYFLAPESLALPNEAPAALLARACGQQVLNRAA
jgi:hypothetical protein